MKYLNENIEITLSLQVPESRTYEYKVYVGTKLIFVGNVFLEVGMTSKTFYLNDLLINYLWKGPIEDGPVYGVIETVKLELVQEGGYDYGTEEVAFLMQYPNYKAKVCTPFPDIDESNQVFMPLLQGFNYQTNSMVLPPTYPRQFTSKVKFGYLGLYDDSDAYQELYVRNSRTGQISSDAIVVGETIHKGVYGFNTQTMDDILSTHAYLLSDKNCKFGFSQGMTNTEFKNGTWSSETSAPTAIDHITVTLYGEYGSTEVTDWYVGDNTFTMFIDKESTSGLTYLRIDFIPRAGNKAYITFDVKELFNQEIQYTVPLRIQFILGDGTSVNEMSIWADGDTELIDADEIVIWTDGTDQYTVVGKLDECSRYFLKWQDRYGMPQMQPFSGTEIYSESITTNQIINYRREKRPGSIEATSKWSLNSKWLNQKLYPYYESIFVSPYLQLYDAKEDHSYDVNVVTQEYTEKTFNNQNRQLFNLQLEVELNKTQQFVY